MSQHTFINKISQKVAEARNAGILFEEIYKDENAKGSNEFLMFIKPEITLEDSKIKAHKILEMIFDKISAFNFNIKNIQVVSAGYLDQFNIIAQHYGVINQLSRNARASLSEDAKNKFKEITGTSVEDANVLGSLEFVEQYPHFNPTALDHLWQNSSFKKLAGGTYMAELNIDGQKVYLINGFHPRQLEHFILSGRSIVTLTLRGNTTWADARGKFIGSTNPASAEKGSIRRELLDNLEDYGLAAITASWNGVHLSAGPVEGLVELQRYNSNFAENKMLTPADFQFGKMLHEQFNEQTINRIIKNENVVFDGKEISVFDLTEEKDSQEAIDLLKQCL